MELKREKMAVSQDSAQQMMSFKVEEPGAV